MKKLLLFLSFCLLIISPALAEIRIGMVFDAGGKNDKSFNQSAWEGAVKARNDLGVTVKDVEPGDTSAVEEAFRTFASQSYDLVVGIGFANAPAIEKVAKEFPKVNFAIVDMYVDQPNVASLVFKEQEGSFLVGMIAGMRARSVDGKRAVGFIGGMDIPLIHKFEAGYRQGAQLIYPDIDVIVNYVGNTGAAWNDPAKAKEISASQISKGSSVIYAAAGGSGAGLFDAIKEHNGSGPCYPKKKRADNCIYAIGVDSNQNYIVPGQILTSMLKRVDVAVYETIKKVSDNNFQSGLNVFDLSNNGVGYAFDSNNRRLINKKMKRVIETFRQKIINGDLIVKDK
ncbi:MAG: BMP family ABC transporter substrate-binding protein [Proteobacteria bacterium]|nr:BMP family ABC transporter substrate-binding protein [Pseudomonadota bacterium]